jgi:hypothetical protein
MFPSKDKGGEADYHCRLKIVNCKLQNKNLSPFVPLSTYMERGIKVVRWKREYQPWQNEKVPQPQKEYHRSQLK